MEPCMAGAALGDIAGWRDMPPGWRMLGTAELGGLCGWCWPWAIAGAGGWSSLMCGA